MGKTKKYTMIPNGRGGASEGCVREFEFNLLQSHVDFLDSTARDFISGSLISNLIKSKSITSRRIFDCARVIYKLMIDGEMLTDIIAYVDRQIKDQEASCIAHSADVITHILHIEILKAVPGSYNVKYNREKCRGLSSSCTGIPCKWCNARGVVN